MNITTDKDVMIFKKDNKYSVAVSKKNPNGEYEKAYIKIEFNKDVELEDKTLIKIKNAWLSFYNWEYKGKKGTTFYIKCSEFVKSERIYDPYDIFANNTKTEFDVGQQVQIDESDLPF
jgi:hypothetical protein